MECDYLFFFLWNCDCVRSVLSQKSRALRPAVPFVFPATLTASAFLIDSSFKAPSRCSAMCSLLPPLSPLFVRSVGGRWLEKQTGTNTCCLKRLETNIRVREWRRPIGGGWNSGKHLSIRNECNGCNEIAFGKWKVLSHQLADIN